MIKVVKSKIASHKTHVSAENREKTRIFAHPNVALAIREVRPLPTQAMPTSNNKYINSA